MRKALVTGANGFIGSHMVDDLLKRNYQIWAMIHNSSSNLEDKKINIVKADLIDLKSLKELRKILYEIDEVYNCLGILGGRRVEDRIY